MPPPPWPIYWVFRKVESFWVIHWCNLAYLVTYLILSIAFFQNKKKAPIVWVGEFVWINFPVQCVCSLHPLRSRCANNKQEQVCAINQRIEIVTSKKERGWGCAVGIRHTKGLSFLDLFEPYVPFCIKGNQMRCPSRPKIRIFDVEGLRDLASKNIFFKAKFEETIKIWNFLKQSFSIWWS